MINYFIYYLGLLNVIISYIVRISVDPHNYKIIFLFNNWNYFLKIWFNIIHIYHFFFYDSFIKKNKIITIQNC